MTKKTATRSTIQKRYRDYLLEYGKAPETVRIFTKFLKVDDEAFYRHFGSLKNIETSIWGDYYSKTLEIIQKDPDFEEMNSREKHLSFLYTMLELLKPDRSYILHKLEGKRLGEFPKELRDAQKVITQSDEINWARNFEFLPKRIKGTTQSAYKRVLSSHTIALLLFWVRDDSGESKDTDVFIEKSTRTAFDVGELPVIDSLFDLSKFFLQKMGFSKTTA